MTEYPTIYHPALGAMTLTIKDDLSFRVAQILWQDIAAKYGPRNVEPTITFTYSRQGDMSQADTREENLARSTIPSDELKPEIKAGNPHLQKLNALAPPKEKGKRGGSNKWQIPFSFYTDRSNYDRAYGLCRRHNLPYPEALKKQEEDTAKGISHKKKVPKGTGKIVRCLYCDYTCNSHVLHIHVKHKHKDKYQEFLANPNRLQQGIHKEPDEPVIRIQGADAIIDQMPTEPTASKLEIRPGVRVKQTSGTKIFPGIGTVKRCPQGKTEVLVEFENGLEWFERKNLTLAEAAP